jgi:hypothetical protein
VVSVARGVYILQVERRDRALFALRVPSTPWKDAMEWLARTPLDTHVLADPGHAWKYGTSVRVAAGRDVFHEEVKDTAVAIYSRDVAVRVIDRSRALGRFDDLTDTRARQLATRYDLDYIVTTRELALPVAYRSPPFTIYYLGPSTASPLKHLGTPIAGSAAGAVSVKVRLTRKLAPFVDGIDLSGHEVGDVFDLPPEDARLVIAEDWAVPERRMSHNGSSPYRRRAGDQRPDPPDDRQLRAS